MAIGVRFAIDARELTQGTAIFPAIAMLAVFALTGGGVVLLRRPDDRKRGALMLVAAFVLLGNVLIWTL